MTDPNAVCGANNTSSYLHCPTCGQPLVGGQFACGHSIKTRKPGFVPLWPTDSGQYEPNPVERSLAEVIAAVKAKYGKAMTIISLPLGAFWVIPNPADYSTVLGFGMTKEAAWRDALRKMEAAEGEANSTPWVENWRATNRCTAFYGNYQCAHQIGHKGLHWACGGNLEWKDGGKHSRSAATPVASPGVVDDGFEAVWQTIIDHVLSAYRTCVDPPEFYKAVAHIAYSAAHAQTKTALAEAEDEVARLRIYLTSICSSTHDAGAKLTATAAIASPAQKEKA